MADDPEVVEISCLSEKKDADDTPVAGLHSHRDCSSNPEKPDRVKSETPVAVRGRTEDRDHVDDDDVEVVDNSLLKHEIQQPARAAGTSTSPSSAIRTRTPEANVDDGGGAEHELEVVGEANVTRLPHNRRDCLEFRFVSDGDASRNFRFCSLCYCYVCDNLAGECESWVNGKKGKVVANERDDIENEGVQNCDGRGGGNDGESPSVGASSTSTATAAATSAMGTAEETPAVVKEAASHDNSHEKHYGDDPCKNHCLATDQGPWKQIWKLLRQAKKNGGDISSLSSARRSQATTASTATIDSLRIFQENYGVDLATEDAMHVSLAREQRRRRIVLGRATPVPRSSSDRQNETVVEFTHGLDVHTNIVAAAGASRSRSVTVGRGIYASVPPATMRRRRKRDGTGDGAVIPSPRRRQDHQQRLRTQAMLEELYK